MYAVYVFDRWEGSYHPIYEDRDAGLPRLFATEREAQGYIRQKGLSTRHNQDCDHGPARYCSAHVGPWEPEAEDPLPHPGTPTCETPAMRQQRLYGVG